MTTATRTTTPPTAADVDYAAAVRDILVEHSLNHPGLHQDQLEDLVGQIVDAHVPRLQRERDHTVHALGQIQHMALREQAQAAHMRQLHDGHVGTLVSRDRYAAQARVLAAQLDRLSALVRTAADQGAAMVAIAEIRAITDVQSYVPVQQRVELLTLVENRTRWSVGVFDRTEGPAEVLPLIGWSIVARHVVLDRPAEPVFRHNGSQLCQTQLRDQGLMLRVLQ